MTFEWSWNGAVTSVSRMNLVRDSVICHHRVTVVSTEIRLTFGIDAEFLTISILNFTFVNINTTSAVVPESRRTLTMIRSVWIDTFSTRAKLIIFIALVNVQTFVHFRTKFHTRRTFTAVINSWSCNMNSCVWSNYYFIFRQRITLMRTFIILLITSIDNFTCPEIRFCIVFQSEILIEFLIETNPLRDPRTDSLVSATGLDRS